MSSKYKFEWIDGDKWRLTSPRGMVWEAQMCYDSSSCTTRRSLSIMHVEAKLYVGCDNPIPTNGLEKVQYYVKKSMISGLRRLMQVMIYNQRLNNDS